MADHDDTVGAGEESGEARSDEPDDKKAPASPESGFIVDEEGRVEVLTPDSDVHSGYSPVGGWTEGTRRFELRAPKLWNGSLRLISLIAVGAYLGLILPEAAGGPVSLWDLLMLAGVPLGVAAFALFRVWRSPEEPQTIECRDDDMVLPKSPDVSTLWKIPYDEIRSVVIMTRGGTEMAMIETDSRRITYSTGDLEQGYGLEMLKREIMRRVRNHPRGETILERMRTLEEHARAATSNTTHVTYGLLGILIVYYAIEHVSGALYQPFGLVQLGANAAPLIDQGHYFRLISCNFLHGNLLHIFLNGLALFFLGLALERTIGPWRLLVIYLVSALGGSIASYYAASPISVGSSTAIFGLVGAFGVLHIKFWRELPPPYRQTLRWWVVILTLNLGFSFLPMVDGAGHIGGLLTGAAVAFVILLPMKSFDPTRPPERALQLATGACVVLFAFGLGQAALYAMGDHPDDQVVLVEQLVQEAVDEGQHTRLNQLAWMTATDREASREQLEVARRAITRGLEMTEERPPQYRDTLATVHYRLGLASSGEARRHHLDEAVRLEHELSDDSETSDDTPTFAPIDASNRRVFRSQLARFLQARLDEYGIYHVGDPWMGASSFELQFESGRWGAELQWTSPPETDTEITGLVFEEQTLLGLLEVCVPDGTTEGSISLEGPLSPSDSSGGGMLSCQLTDTSNKRPRHPHVRPAMTETSSDCGDTLKGRFWPMSPEVEAYP